VIEEHPGAPALACVLQHDCQLDRRKGIRTLELWQVFREQLRVGLGVPGAGRRGVAFSKVVVSRPAERATSPT
jgi:hypothetical protein